MKRYTIDHARAVAKVFATSDLARAWHMFGSRMRRVIVDSLVMDSIRMSDVADSLAPTTPQILVEFRETIEHVLSTEGVPRRGDVARRFHVDD